MARLMRFTGFVAVMACVALAVFYQTGGFQEKVEPSLAEANRQPGLPPATEIAEVRFVAMPLVEESVGTLQSRNRVEVSPQIQATILEITRNAGDQVTAGDIVVRLDPRDLDARVGQAEQAERAAEANNNQAAADYERSRELLARGAVSQQEADNARLRLEVTSASLGEARRALEQARIARSYAEIRAPVSGVVIEKNQNAGDVAMPGKPILSLYDPSLLRLEAPVRESLAVGLRRGQIVRVRLGPEQRETTGTVDEIVPQADIATRSFLVKVLVEGASGGFYAGMFGRLLLDVGTEQVLVAPKGAVERVGQLELMTAVTTGGTERRFVQTGRDFGEMVEVLSGVGAGDRVAVRGAVGRS
ncbi:MAG: efflux RND transporter periplasmic adaptor subunit [Candidatus Sumerlaeaceae bacterium]|nr:efflux RND transporter periplasmic adaptor subunit [Candidatus Sumerlaeaceae bacterium]